MYNALQGLGNVLVRKLADVLRRNDIDDGLGLTFDFERFQQACANAGDQHRFDLITLGIRRLLRIGQSVFCQRQGDGGGNQGRLSRVHKAPRIWFSCRPIWRQDSTNQIKNTSVLNTNHRSLDFYTKKH
jgi:hypothetical protein